MISKPVLNENGEETFDRDGKRVWKDEDDVIQGIVLLRKGEESLPALVDVKALVADINSGPGHTLPGVTIAPYYDRTRLINTTTETVRENLFHGMVLVALVLLMFLGNVRTAIIVAINVPLAVLVAFAALYLRGESANLLSIGAVDFGILVDSSVIMVENIYRHLTHDHRRIDRSKSESSTPRPKCSAACSFRPRSWSVRSCRCSRWKARRARSSVRWPTPMPSHWAEPCCWP